eukprot:TRINITY_DN3089_c0_g1_i2.p1 TRINITY_DN3089_c0_g1~~TRINITY_DN3089_c0_g1_i2.p1  ORF type:complete len:192 (+),score=35.43 TRINITY_DN3089_c0_g1_i2:200-775(+)
MDQLTREIYEPGCRCYNSVVKTFGTGVLDKCGIVDRTKLGEVVFSNKEKVQQLNSITHKYVAWLLLKRILWHFLTGTKLLFLDSALLIETGLYRLCHVVVVVSVPNREIQLRYLMSRDGSSREYALQRIASQIDDQTRRRYADWIIENSGDKENLFQETKRMLEFVSQKSSWISREMFFIFFLCSLVWLLK